MFEWRKLFLIRQEMEKIKLSITFTLEQGGKETIDLDMFICQKPSPTFQALAPKEQVFPPPLLLLDLVP